jgi:hypothetical protein
VRRKSRNTNQPERHRGIQPKAESFDSMQGRHLYLSAFGIGIAAFLVYLFSLYPSVAGGDSGELVVAALTVGVPHPSGYPLYVLIGKAFASVPVHSIAWRLNALSACCDAGAVILLALAIGDISGNAAAGVAAAGLFAFSPTVWMYATVAEVFALNNLCVAAQLFLAARAWLRPDSRYVYLLALVVGLGVSNHLTSGVTGVVLLGGVVISRLRRGELPLASIGVVALAVASGLLPYLLLPLASRASVPSPAQWGDESTWSGFLTHVLRREYGTFRLGGSPFVSRSGTLEQIGAYAADALRQLMVVGFPLAVWGLYRAIRTGRLRGLVAVMAAAYVVYIIAFHSLANLPLEQPLFHGIVARFWQQPNLFVCAWAGLGLAMLPGRWPRIGAAAVCGAVLAGSVFHGRDLVHRSDWTIHDYGQSLLRPLPQNTLVVTRGDIQLNAVRYLLTAERERPDVRVLDQEMLTFRWMKPIVLRRMPDIVIPGTHYDVRDPGSYTLRELVDANIALRPIVVCGGVKEGDPSLDAAYDRWPLGLCDQVLPRSAPMNVSEWYELSRQALPTIRSGSIERTPVDSWERLAWDEVWDARHRRELKMLTLAITRRDADLFVRAAEGYDALLKNHPSPPVYYFKNAGIAFNALHTIRPGMTEKAVSAWRTYLQRAPAGDPDAAEIQRTIATLESDRPPTEAGSKK